MCWMWWSAVLGEMWRRPAMSFVVRPRAASRSTATSRRVRPPGFRCRLPVRVFGSPCPAATCTAERRHVRLREPQHAGRVLGELRATAAVAAPVRRLEVDEVGHDIERVVELGADEEAVRLGLEREDGIP